LASHKIDCILIQDDFILRYNEGFSNWGRAQFAGAAGVPAKEKLMMAAGTPYNLNWKKVKIARLNKVLKLIVRSCKSINSAIKVGMNVYYEAPIRVEDAEAWYSHNLREIAGTGLDYIYLMSYHRQIKDEMKLSETKNRELFKQIVEKAYDICKEKLIVKIQLRDWKTGQRIPAKEVKAYLALVPPQVKRICFTPVTIKDYDYLEEIIGSSNKSFSGVRGAVFQKSPLAAGG
jgi:biofilm PGA synthesis lipoprotein PgaB